MTSGFPRISRRVFSPPPAPAPSARWRCPISAAPPTADHHAWRAIRRHRGRWRRGMGARGPALADDGRGRHDGIVCQCAGVAADRGAARERLHRENAAGKSARRAGDLLSRPVSRSLAYRYRSEPVVGRFRTAPADRRDVSFVWGGDVAGQGWGINPDDGGMFTFATMRKHRPDFLLHSGDTIYADGIDPARSDASRRQDLEERDDPGKGKGRRDARRVPRRA